MITPGLRDVPAPHRGLVEAALRAAFGTRGVDSVRAVPGGASGALALRVESTAGPHLLRVEGPRSPLRNPHQYDCASAAAEAGIAPPLRFLDADQGIMVMPFIDQRPVSGFPGGPPAVAQAAGELLARLHDLALFPAHGDYLDNLARMLGFLRGSGRVATGLLDRHAEGLERIRAAYPWSPDAFVSCHNDPNQFNLLFDGDRLWLIDWETASRSDPMIDIATVASHVAPTPELVALLLRSSLGREPDDGTRARLVLATLLINLFTGAILLLIAGDPAAPPHADLDAPTPAEFERAVERGELVAGTPATTTTFAKVVLRAFADGIGSPDFDTQLLLATS